MLWHSVTHLTRSEKDGISADIYVPSDSPWFSGHFPAQPILPGVAQIRMVLDTISIARRKNLKVAGVRRVRFKQIIHPEDSLTIEAAPLEKNDDAYSFRIAVEDETVCSGVMTVKQQDNQIEHKEEMNKNVNGNQR
jgi:3-hydroxymyristoyl/3-hydroxydecanoyl-(acyl carrier protein) dehydratase